MHTYSEDDRQIIKLTTDTESANYIHSGLMFNSF